MTKDPAPISVIIPTYNRAGSIGAAIRSVLYQSLTPDEVIVIDDGSDDETESVVAEIKSPMIRYIRQENAGANVARNRGVEESRNDFVAFHDSDDIWLPGKLQSQWLELEGGVVKASFGRFLRVSDRSATIMPISKPSEYSEERVRAVSLIKNMLSTQTLVIEKDTLLRIGGFDPNLGRFQDWDLFIRLMKDVSFNFQIEPLVVAFDGSDSITRNYAAGIEARRYFLQKYHKEFHENFPAHLRSRTDLFIRVILQDIHRILRRRPIK
ncbi:hypothetical protein NBRC116598_40870 [Pseudophaeobacter arcticus]|uniref:Glycosyltransferase 2-like domain-containing protein n=1 Tax=Pseudophaeobacter arcticus TaxID=385492 RepID=A0ABQ0ARY6_9RHOB